MLYFKIYLPFVFIFSKAFPCIKTINSHLPKNNDGCCLKVDENNLPRIDPPIFSSSYGWSNKSGLKYYEERICPLYAIYECNLNKNVNGTNVVIQFVQGEKKIIYEDKSDEHVAILVFCVNGEWVLNGSTFTSITCSQN